jgi:trans-aconitate methyltransferase
MKYQPVNQPIPQEHREEINSKILQIIDSGELPDGITHEDIYNGYTGVGGLHGLSRSDYDSFHAYTEDKKEIEQGQFFTPSAIVEQIAALLQPTDHDLICDLSCGSGAFFNHFKEHNCYGCDIDAKAVKVAKFLYPAATIDIRDVRFYEPGLLFDLVIGNPPFNLRWDTSEGEVPSQLYYCTKAASLLKPGGILCIVVPDSFLKDEFFNRSAIEDLDERYNFLFQYKLSDTAFKPMGVERFETKVMCFQRHADSLGRTAYSSKYISYETALLEMERIVKEQRSLKAKLAADRAKQYAHEHAFEYKLKKYLYEIGHHPVLKPHLARARGHVEKLYNQKQPENISDKEWEKQKLTPGKVLAYLREIMDKQKYTKSPYLDFARKHKTPRKWLVTDEYKLVKYNYGFKLKSYSGKADHQMREDFKAFQFPWYDIVREKSYVRQIIANGSRNASICGRGLVKLYKRKIAEYKHQQLPFDEMPRHEAIDAYIGRFKFYNGDNELSQFNERQKLDLGLILQKQYGILNWQQGGGKTAAAAAWSKYKPLRNTFVVGPAIAVKMTWTKFLVAHRKEFVHIEKWKDCRKMRPGIFIIVSLEMLIKYERYIKRYIKQQSGKVNLIFDESDNITNSAAKRTRAMLSCFRRVKRKLLTTGTTTRNNINELYSQLELLYNNSINMISEPQYYWVESEDKEDKGELKRRINPHWDEPFPAKGGALVFKRCFNPAKTTVFGIQKHNQDLYNSESLKRTLSYTIRTRKFREIAGDKYTIKTLDCDQNAAEEEVYRIIIDEFESLVNVYYESTGNARKDAMLKIIRQLQLLIEATSTPHLFSEYNSSELPGKAKLIFDYCQANQEKIAIGCTTVDATEWYYNQLRQRFPSRSIFKVVGDVQFNGRENIRAMFESTHNGILVCTQQSLSSSVSIPTCNKVLIESKQWNIPKIEQFFFRFIRYNSREHTDVTFLNYRNTIEVNLMALLMSKEKLNDFIKTLEYRDNSDIYGEYDVDLDILNQLLTKEEVEVEPGKYRVRVSWGKATAA